MAVSSVVPLSQLEYSRIDADFYHPTYLNELQSWRQVHKHVGVVKLGHVIAAPIRTGRTPKFREVKGNEPCVRFIKTDTVREGSIDFDNSALLPKRVIGGRDYIPDDALVMTIIGATPEIVGRTAMVRSADPECVTNQNVAVICTAGTCDAYYLAAYFQTKWGRDQVWRHSRRTEQVNLNCREVERVLVPNPATSVQKAIGDLVRESFASGDRSRLLYQEVEQLLQSKLGLGGLEFQKPVGYAATFSRVEASRRFDAEHYYPAFESFRKGLPGDVTLSPLSTFLDFCQRGQQPTYAIKGLPVINSKHVQSNRVISNGNRLARPSADANLRIRFGDTLLNGTGRGTIGRAAPYLSEGMAVADNHVTILRSTKLDPAYLALYLNSRAGQLQVDMYQRGSSGQLELYPRDIRKFLVWPAPPEFQQEIRRIHDLAAAAERESHILLEQAKSRVEQLIREAIQS